MAFIVYEYLDYKIAIKDRVKDLKKTKAKFSLQYLSEVLSIQYTFLSKVLNSDSHQLNEDQIFSVGYALEFLNDEVEYLLLLRSYQATSHQARKSFLFQKISTLQKRHSLSLNTEKNSSPSDFADDMHYLMDSTALIVHAALSIKAVQKNPFCLASQLGLDQVRVKEILILLDRMGRIEYDMKKGSVNKLIHSRSHFGKDHPLTRTHQLVMKTALNQLSFTKSEEKKENMFVTFTTDPEGFELIKKQIKIFMSDVQKITMDHKHTGVYQMNLDFVQILS
jgi:uncharacterized protein (TIGR02147 family)